MKLEFSQQTFEKRHIQIPNITKIRPLGAELFQADGWTDMKRLIVAFRNFPNASKKLEYGSTRMSY